MSGSFWRSVGVIVRKDLTLERHTGRTVSVMAFFSLAAIITFNLALQGDLSAVRSVASGLLWVTIVLAGTLGLSRTMGGEQENRTLDALLIAPLNRAAIYVAKVISVSLFAGLLELFLLFLFFIFTGRPFLQPAIWGILFLGTIGYAGAGVLVTAMTIQTRARDVLLPVVLLPLSLPIVLAAASATAALVSLPNPTWSDMSFAVALVVFYDVLIILIGFFTFEYVIEE